MLCIVLHPSLKYVWFDFTNGYFVSIVLFKIMFDLVCGDAVELRKGSVKCHREILNLGFSSSNAIVGV